MVSNSAECMSGWLCVPVVQQDGEAELGLPGGAERGLHDVQVAQGDGVLALAHQGLQHPPVLPRPQRMTGGRVQQQLQGVLHGGGQMEAKGKETEREKGVEENKKRDEVEEGERERQKYADCLCNSASFV